MLHRSCESGVWLLEWGPAPRKSSSGGRPPPLPGTAQAQTPPPWPFAGGDLANSRARLGLAGPQQINTATSSKLAVKWTFSSGGAILATPTVEQGGLYVTDFANTLYKINPDTGALIWSHPFSYYTGSSPHGAPGSNSRSGDRQPGRDRIGRHGWRHRLCREPDDGRVDLENGRRRRSVCLHSWLGGDLQRHHLYRRDLEGGGRNL